MKRIFCMLTLISIALVLLPSSPVRAEESGVYASVVVDEDGDDAILMESEWISMHLLPWRQALINRFVFTPTGNDIVESTNAKQRQAGGGGILMDCLWEQDWRFQELGFKSYEYKILKNGPDEAQVQFETNIVGWVGMENSGIISKLLSDLTLRRTVTLKSGQPFFRFDIEFINNGSNAKRPTFWVHNGSHIASRINAGTWSGKESSDTMIRPTARGLSAIGAGEENYPAIPRAQDFIRDFNAGWTANINAARREGIIYLMDYDCVDTLYNCGNMTTEWFYDGILVPRDRPWKGHVYILPVIGLTHVNFANEYLIVALDAKREDGVLTLEYKSTASYEKAVRVTFATSVEHELLADKIQTLSLPEAVIDTLSIQPATTRAEVPFTGEDPLIFDVTATVELPDGSVKQFAFQHFYTGEYKLRGNETNAQNNNTPIKLLRRKVKKPDLPPVPSNLAINRKDLKVFGVLGQGSFRLGIEQAVRAIPNATLDVGYCAGNDPAQNGLTDFPYDYDRLFDHRVMLLSNIQDKEFRRIGASIMMPWLKAGGGLVISGGINSFTFEYEEHEINDCYPFVVKKNNIRKGPLQLKAPLVKDHPIFRGVDLSDLPWMQFYHDVALKPGSKAKVLMQVGDKPFIVEQKNGNQITMVIAVNSFGAESTFPGKTPVFAWSQWPKLYANIVRYAAGDLK